MTNWPPYNPYINYCRPCGYTSNANCAAQNINYANTLNVDDIVEQLRPTPCDPVFHSYKFTFGSEEDYTEPYEIVAVQEPDE